MLLVSVSALAGAAPGALAEPGAEPVVLGRRGLRPGGGQQRAGLVRDAAAARTGRLARSAEPTRARAVAQRHRLAPAECQRAVGRRTEHAARRWRGCACRPTGARWRITSTHGPAMHGAALQTRQRDAHSVPADAQAAAVEATPPVGTFADGGDFVFDVGSTCARSGPGSTCWPTRASAPSVSEAGGGYHLGRQQPPEPAHALVQRPRGRPAFRVAAAAGPALARGRGASRPRPRARRPRPTTCGMARATASSSTGAATLAISATWCVDAQDRSQTGAAAGDQPGAAHAPAALGGGVSNGCWARSAAIARGVYTAVRQQALGEAAIAGAAGHAAGAQRRLRRRHGVSGQRLCRRTSGTSTDWTCDRREFFDARGRPVVPDRLRPTARRRRRPLRGTVAAGHGAGRGDDRTRAAAGLGRQPGAGARAGRAGRRSGGAPAAAHGAGRLGRIARCHRGHDARPACSTRWSTAGCSIRPWPAACGPRPASTRPAAPPAFATSCRTRWR